MTSWTPAFNLADIPKLGARTLVSGGVQVAVFRTENDAVFAIEDSCPHKQGPLSQGIVHGASVTCPLHNWVIELASGKAVSPDVGCVKRFGARTVNGVVEVDLALLEAKTAA